MWRQRREKKKRGYRKLPGPLRTVMILSRPWKITTSKPTPHLPTGTFLPTYCVPHSLLLTPQLGNPCTEIPQPKSGQDLGQADPPASVGAGSRSPHCRQLPPFAPICQINITFVLPGLRSEHSWEALP